jgi:glycosyltransferase involved in cell wall biosynthesis
MTVWFNVTSSTTWSGTPVGITRVEFELSKHIHCERFLVLGNTIKHFSTIDHSRNLQNVDSQKAGRRDKISHSRFIRIANFLESTRHFNPYRNLLLSLAHATAVLYGRNKFLDRSILKISYEITKSLELIAKIIKRYKGARNSRPISNKGIENLGIKPENTEILVEHPFEDGDIVITCGLDWDSEVMNLLDDIKSQTQIRIVTTVYDMIPVTNPEYIVSSHYASVLLGHFTNIARSADVVMLNSTTVKNKFVDFCEEIGLPTPTTVIVPWGYNKDLISEALPPFYEQIRSPFVLTVGTLEIRKNHKVLMDAIRIAKLKDAEFPQIVIVGRPGWGTIDLQQELNSLFTLESDVVWLKNTTDSELMWLYKNASLLLSPSLDEGYGLPIVEAAAHGTPILISDIPLYRELFPNSLFADPLNPHEWFEKIVQFSKVTRENSSVHPDWTTAARQIVKAINDVGLTELQHKEKTFS